MEVNRKKIPRLISDKLINIPLKSPHCIKYSSNGRFLLLSSSTSLASFDTKKLNVMFERPLKNTTSMVYLHDESYIATIQDKEVFIYDKIGRELHKLKDHYSSHRLTFLPYHFLLASVSTHPFIRWTDTTSGKCIANHFIGNPSEILEYDPSSALLYTNKCGVLSAWSPSSKEPLIKILAHRRGIRSVKFSPTINSIITADENLIKVWDSRNMERPLSHLVIANTSIDISQRGLIAVAKEKKVVLLDSQLNIIGTERFKDKLTNVEFQPFEDILSMGSMGINSIVVPGAGEATYDVYEDNPFMTTRQRQSREVKKLLEKIPYEMIGKHFQVEE